MYGPKKPGIIRRGWWFWKEKLCSMTGLYVISVILLMAFLMNIVDSLGMTYGYLVFNLYIAGLLNVALWIYLFRRIRKDTSTPFFMNWMKNILDTTKSQPALSVQLPATGIVLLLLIKAAMTPLKKI